MRSYSDVLGSDRIDSIVDETSQRGLKKGRKRVRRREKGS